MLDLMLYIEYEGEKAAKMRNASNVELPVWVRRDCDVLKLPHPPQANIKKVKNEDGVVLLWQAKRDSTVHKRVRNVVRHKEMSKSKKSMESCSIKDVHFKELSPKDRFELGLCLLAEPRTTPETAQHCAQLPLKSYNKESISRLVSEEEKPTQSQAKRDAGVPERCPPEVERLMQERETVQKETTQAIYKAYRIEGMLESLGVTVEPMRPQFQDGMASSVKLFHCLSELLRERIRREEVEGILSDVRKECTAPQIIPGILRMASEMA